MKSKYVFISNKEFFENTVLRNPILASDNKIENYFPEFYELNYDLRLLATKPASKDEKEALFYNNYRERYGTTDIQTFDLEIADSSAKNIFLLGFNQEQFQYTAPLIKDTAEVLYFFKCPKIHDLSMLSHFPKLKCVFVYWNNSFESLWDMKNNEELKVISFIQASKINNIDTLQYSNIEYLTLDSSDLYGKRKEMLFDKTVIEKMPKLKHLTLVYKGCKIEY